MAHPKRKISQQRRDKRRAHHKLVVSTYRPHQAEWQDDGLYYKGVLVLEKEESLSTSKS